MHCTAARAAFIAAPVVSEEPAYFVDYNTRFALKWKSGTLIHHEGLSYVYNHVLKVGLKCGVLDSNLYKILPALQKVVHEDNWICSLYNGKGK